MEDDGLAAGKIPALGTGGTIAAAGHGVSGDAGFAPILHKGDGIITQQCTRHFDARPRAEHETEIFGEGFAIDCGEEVVPLSEGKKLGAGMRTNNAQPHIEIFAGEEIAGDMNTEHTRGVRGIKIPGEIGFKGGEILLSEGEVFRIGVADAGAEAFQLAGIAAFAEAGFAGGRGTGRAGG